MTMTSSTLKNAIKEVLTFGKDLDGDGESPISIESIQTQLSNESLTDIMNALLILEKKGEISIQSQSIPLSTPLVKPLPKFFAD